MTNIIFTNTYTNRNTIGNTSINIRINHNIFYNNEYTSIDVSVFLAQIYVLLVKDQALIVLD